MLGCYCLQETMCISGKNLFAYVISSRIPDFEVSKIGCIQHISLDITNIRGKQGISMDVANTQIPCLEYF